MSSEKRKIERGKIYHVLNRGVDFRQIFLDERDYFRFIHDMYHFNDGRASTTVNYYFQKFPESLDLRGPDFRKKRRPIINILSFCLMPNHYHLLLQPIVEKGLVKFLSKLNMGYAKYFNERHKRAGTLFQGRYKCISISDESHFIHIPYYIHCNPLDLIAPEWREKKILNPKKVIEFLNNYRWSSHLDYCGKHNFPSITNRSFLLKVFGGEKKYQQEINDWIKNMEIADLKEAILE